MNAEEVKEKSQEIVDNAKTTESITSDQLQVAVWNHSFSPEQASFIAQVLNNWRVNQFALDAVSVLEYIEGNTEEGTTFGDVVRDFLAGKVRE